MADENSEKIIHLLEEIRDLTKERNAKLETLVQSARDRAEAALQRQRDAQQRATAQRLRFLWTLTPLLLLALGFTIYLGFWVIPESDRKQMQQMQDYRTMQSNYLNEYRAAQSNSSSQPH
jgi:hypothetical protein